jgi:hypothetical protein
MLGDDYSVVDVAVWGWGRLVPFALGDAAQAKLPHLKRLVVEINLRPAVARSAARREGYPFKSAAGSGSRQSWKPTQSTMPSATSRARPGLRSAKGCAGWRSRSNQAPNSRTSWPSWKAIIIS